jgi:hypothetical protein
MEYSTFFGARINHKRVSLTWLWIHNGSGKMNAGLENCVQIWKNKWEFGKKMRIWKNNCGSKK